MRVFVYLPEPDALKGENEIPPDWSDAANLAEKVLARIKAKSESAVIVLIDRDRLYSNSVDPALSEAREAGLCTITFHPNAKRLGPAKAHEIAVWRAICEGNIDYVVELGTRDYHVEQLACLHDKPCFLYAADGTMTDTLKLPALTAPTLATEAA